MPLPAKSVNAALPRVAVLDQLGQPQRNAAGKPLTLAPSDWLDQYRAVQTMTWAPGNSSLIIGWLFTDGGWKANPISTVYNLYRPAEILPGNPAEAGPWLEHLEWLYPDHWPILAWFAYRLQHPEIKINHGLILIGPTGIGKDTLLEPVKQAVGAWNFAMTLAIMIASNYMSA